MVNRAQAVVVALVVAAVVVLLATSLRSGPSLLSLSGNKHNKHAGHGHEHTHEAKGLRDGKQAKSKSNAKGEEEEKEETEAEGDNDDDEEETDLNDDIPVNYWMLEPHKKPPFAEFRGKKFKLSPRLAMVQGNNDRKEDGLNMEPVDENGMPLPFEGDFAPIPYVNERWRFTYLLERLEAKTALQIGVRGGDFTNEIIKSWKEFKRIYLIEEWKSFGNTTVDQNNDSDQRKEEMYKQTQDRFKEFGDRFVIIRDDPVEAARHVPDESIDFIYLDHRHDYCSVSKYLKAYWPKLSRGGIFAGHDFLDNKNSLMGESKQDWGTCPDGTKHDGAVKGAVEDFVKAHSDSAGRINLTRDGWPSFYFRKFESSI